MESRNEKPVPQYQINDQIGDYRVVAVEWGPANHKDSRGGRSWAYRLITSYGGEALYVSEAEINQWVAAGTVAGIMLVRKSETVSAATDIDSATGQSLSQKVPVSIVTQPLDYTSPISDQPTSATAEAVAGDTST